MTEYPKRLFHPSAPVCVDVQDAEQETAWEAQGWRPERPADIVTPDPADPPADQAPGVVDAAGPELIELPPAPVSEDPDPEDAPAD